MTETPKMPRTTTERSEPITFEIPDYVKLMEFPRIETQFVAILGHHHINRGMIASPYHTRCIRHGEIHELVVVLENEEGLIDLNDAWYLGFIEFKEGSVLAKGMTAEIDGNPIGTLIGFDITHIPNHFNILIASKTPQIGTSAGIKIKDKCFFEMNTKSA